MPDKKVQVHLEQLTIPTYRIGDEDPNPPILREGGYWRIYPYAMLDDLREEKYGRTYTALVLENEFIRVTVLPELGGHLYSAYDKAAGREIFYTPKVIKPGLVALRGAWIAGGIEFNFPCSHNYVTVSDVDWRIRENEDGSAAVFVGAIERVSRMRWTVGVSLHPGRNQVYTDIRIENRTGLPHRYYFWSNSAERVTMGTRFISPVTSGYGWKGVMRYPIHEGEEISYYRDHVHSLDLFSRNLQGDFFGCYDYDLEEGVVNVADRYEVTGRKYFTWGNSEDGLVWQYILSDDDGPYVEIQSGPFPTQSIFKMMEPHRVQRWRETWYGVREMGGFEFANEVVALNLIRDEAAARVTANATRAIENATITATEGESVVGEWRGMFGPEHPVSFPVSLSDPEGRVEITVASETDGEIARAMLPWVGREDDLTDPALTSEEKNTPRGLVAQGYEQEKLFELQAARDFYDRAIGADPLCAEALVRLGILDLKAGLFDTAAERLGEVVRIMPDSGEANYYLGHARRAKGDREGATRAFWAARLSPQFGPTGRYFLGEMVVEAGDLEAALGHFEYAAAHEAVGTKSWCMRCATLRELGRLDEADAAAQGIFESDPLNPLLAFERALISEAQGEENIWEDVRALTREDPQTCLEVATDYAGAGFMEIACRILSMAREIGNAAMVRYLLAYYLEGRGCEEGAQDLYLEAARMPSDHVFPHRIEAETVLCRAMEVNPADPNAPYYLGTMLYMVGRMDEGRALWRRAAGLGCDNSALYRSLGFACWKKDGDPKAAMVEYERAIQHRPDDYRLHADMDQLRAELGVSFADRLSALRVTSDAVRSKGTIATRMVQLHVFLEQYDDAIRILHSRRFDPWEGAMGMRRIHVDAHVGRGEERMDAGDFAGAREEFETALEYPVSIGVGRRYRASDAPIFYRAGEACEAMEDAAAARAHWENGLQETHHPIPSVERVYVEMCRMKLGRTVDAAANLGAILHEADRRGKDTPDDARNLLTAGLAAAALGQIERARTALKAATKLDPSDTTARRELKRLRE